MDNTWTLIKIHCFEWKRKQDSTKDSIWHLQLNLLTNMQVLRPLFVMRFLNGDTLPTWIWHTGSYRGSFGRSTCFGIFDTCLSLWDMVPNIHYLAESYVFPFGACSTSYQWPSNRLFSQWLVIESFLDWFIRSFWNNLELNDLIVWVFHDVIQRIPRFFGNDFMQVWTNLCNRKSSYAAGNNFMRV